MKAGLPVRYERWREEGGRGVRTAAVLVDCVVELCETDDGEGG